MNLLQPWVAVVAVIVAIVAFVLGFLGFTHVRGARPIRVLQRVGILLLVQTVLVGALGLQVNYKLGFFRTPSEVMGMLQEGPVIQHAQVLATPAAPSKIETNPQRYKVQWQATDEDGVKQAEIVGPESGVDGQVRAWVPSGYPKAGVKYDVIVLLPGTPGSSAQITSAIGAQQTLQDAINKGTIPPTILVTADMNIGGVPTNCADLEGDYKVETWLSKDVPALIRANFDVTPNRVGWTIMGPSMGAYCAVRMAVLHSDTFANAAWLHGIDRPVENQVAENPQLATQETLSNLLKRRHLPLNMLLVASAEDPGTISDARAIHQAAPKSDGVTLDELKHGGHEWGQWTKEFHGVVRWLGNVIDAEEAKR